MSHAATALSWTGGGLETGGLRAGWLVAVDESGTPFVDLPENEGPPLRARTLVTLPDLPERLEAAVVPVLLAFEGGDARRPVVLGLLQDRVVPPRPAQGAGGSTDALEDSAVSAPLAEAGLPAGEALAGLEVLADGDRVVLEAREEIVLCCGKSSLTLRRDGKIVLRGVEVTSRASRVNKIKGGSVAIN